MFPRQLLTSHFWTIQQRNDFSIKNLKDRLDYNRSVFRILQKKLSQMEKSELQEKWNHILVQLGSGLHPTAGEIIETKDIWTKAPYNTSSCNHTHVVRNPFKATAVFSWLERVRSEPLFNPYSKHFIEHNSLIYYYFSDICAVCMASAEDYLNEPV